MMFDKYPHTELQDLNLDWILAQVKGFKADLGTLQTQFNTMSIDFASIQSQFANLSDQVNNLMQTMQDEIERYCDSVIPGKVDAAVAPYIVQLQDALAEVEALKNMITGVYDEINRLRAYSDQGDTNLKNDYMTRIAVLEYDMLLQIARVNARIDNIEFELPDIYNIVKGYETNIAYAIYDVYDACRYFALTALQYDLKGLTASEFDALNYGALDLDINGYKLLYPPTKCLNPLTGVAADICAILQDLALFASARTWTALLWDSTWERDADTIDALDITAFNFDYTDDAAPI